MDQDVGVCVLRGATAAVLPATVTAFMISCIRHEIGCQMTGKDEDRMEEI